jgi:hypothetical protein
MQGFYGDLTKVTNNDNLKLPVTRIFIVRRHRDPICLGETGIRIADEVGST